MKQSWIIGSITLWLLIFVMEMMATGGTAFNQTVVNDMNVMTAPSLVNFSGALSALSTVITNLGTFFSTFISGLFLWSPTVFTGNWIWFWQLVCFPIAVSFIMVIVSIARGVHAS